MSRVRFTRHLIRFFPEIGPKAEVDISGETVADIIRNLDRQFPGLAAYIVDEHGRLRRHVNIFLNQDLIQDRQGLTDTVSADARIYIYQALSGG